VLKVLNLNHSYRDTYKEIGTPEAVSLM
jgi:hypothetical protein